MTGYEASGLHNPDNKEERYFRMGNLKIDYRGEVTIDDNGNPALRLDYPISNLLLDNERLYGESVRQKILDVCNLKKGVSDVAFYYGTMMITQELFSLYRRYPPQSCCLHGMRRGFFSHPAASSWLRVSTAHQVQHHISFLPQQQQLLLFLFFHLL